MHRIGILSVGKEPSPYLPALRERLAELGHVEGKNLRIDDRSTVPDYKGLEIAAQELIASKVDAIVTNGSTATKAARSLTSSLPIVMLAGLDPIKEGYAKSLTRPGGNLTGIRFFIFELIEQRLDCLRETLPSAQSVATVFNMHAQGEVAAYKNAEALAKTKGFQLVPIEYGKAEQLEKTLTEKKRESKLDAGMVLPSTLLTASAAQICDAFLKNGLPFLGTSTQWGDAGALVTVALDLSQVGARAAESVSRILNGTPCGEIPIEEAKKSEIILNLNTARELGFEFPKSLRARANKMIELS